MKPLSRFVLIGFLVLGLAMAEARPRPRPGGGGGGLAGGFKAKPKLSKPVAHPPLRPPKGPSAGTLPAKPGKPGSGPGFGGGHKPIGGGPGVIKPKPNPFPAKPGGKPGAGDIGKFIGNNPPGHFPGNPAYRPNYPGYHKGEFQGNIHRRFPYHPTYGYPFSQNWCSHFNWHYVRWPYWTAAATAVSLTRWIGVNAYAGYGYAEQIPYYPVEPAPPEVYESSIAAPVEAVEQGQKEVVADDVEWMNMGTFGIIPYKETDFAYGVQMATTKDGIVRGIQWDMKNNTSNEIEGSIQKDTLRIAWQAKLPEAFYFETNVDELTQQELMVNVYNPKTKGLVSWQMIQIEDKDLPAAK